MQKACQLFVFGCELVNESLENRRLRFMVVLLTPSDAARGGEVAARAVSNLSGRDDRFTASVFAHGARAHFA